MTRVFREVHGSAIATLTRMFRDIELAEDALQDAFAVATERWPAEGLPPNPAGWIVTTARRRAIDVVRRSARGSQLAQEAALQAARSASDVVEPSAIADDRLRLIFTCCHPALGLEHRVALTLRLLGGLEVEDIARAFLIGEAAMAKRLVRAKYKIKAAGIPYRVPSEAELPARLAGVLAVLFLIYNAGADDRTRADLRAEAIRLARGLRNLMPGEPEAAGLLALLLLNESRMPARGVEEIIPLRDQDRSRWDRELIAEGHAIVRQCIEIDRPGPYQLQAAIQAVHCDAPTFDATDWVQVVTLYNHLAALQPTPIVALNRAIAEAETVGPSHALAEIDAIAPAMDGYHLLHAARATMLRRLGRDAEAAVAFQRAIEQAPGEAERRFLAAEAARVED